MRYRITAIFKDGPLKSLAFEYTLPLDRAITRAIIALGMMDRHGSEYDLTHSVDLDR